MASTQSFIVCDNLVRIYRVLGHDVVALQGLDVTISKGEILGIVGVSGSGKTTLMNILGGLDRPTAGRIWVNGQDLLKLSDLALNRYRLTSVGFLWQQSARNLVPYLNALENVEYPLTIAGEFGGSKRKRATQLLQAVGLYDRRRHRLSELSGGEQQRVAIAVALANNPKLLLADEPTGEVDQKTAGIIYEIFHNLQKEFGLTILIVSHDTNLAHYVDRVISIRDGKVSTETVWQDFISSQDEVTDEISTGRKFEELTVVDTAGRLQIPKEMREQYHIADRVRLQPTDDGLLIKPVVTSTTLSAEDMVDHLEHSQKRSLFKRLFYPRSKEQN